MNVIIHEHPDHPPAQRKHARLRELAKHRDMSVNKFIEDLATISLAEFDAENHFRTMAAHGSVKKGMTLLDQLDAAFRRDSK